jgi:hypothetical protein
MGTVCTLLRPMSPRCPNRSLKGNYNDKCLERGERKYLDKSAHVGLGAQLLLGCGDCRGSAGFLLGAAGRRAAQAAAVAAPHALRLLYDGASSQRTPAVQDQRPLHPMTVLSEVQCSVLFVRNCRVTWH